MSFWTVLMSMVMRLRLERPFKSASKKECVREKTSSSLLNYGEVI